MRCGDSRIILPEKTLAIVMAGGRGQRLYELTDDCAKPAIDFGGKFKIIDFTLSNCVNSGIRKIMVLTQYNSHGLLDHLQAGWGFLAPTLGEFVKACPAHQSLDSDAWYSGTADAVYQNMRTIRSQKPDNVLILAGDHVYKMDYRKFLLDHTRHDADMTIACFEVPRPEASGFGVVQVDSEGRIIGFVEKPAHPPTLPGRPDTCLVSMGIYLIRADFLYRELALDASDPASSHDFGKDIIPKLIDRARIMAHAFSDSVIANGDRPPYWKDVGTVDAFLEANLDLTRVAPDLSLYDEAWPILTHQEQLPGAKFVHDDPDRTGLALSSVVSGGCIISGADVRRSLLFNRVRVHSRAALDRVVALPGVDIGEGARIRNAIITKGTRIPAGMVIGEDAAQDAARFRVSPAGVILVSQKMINAI